MEIIDATDRFQGNYTQQRNRTPWVVVHHAAWDYRPRYGLDAVRAIADYHTLKWGKGIAYHIIAAQFSPNPTDVRLVQCSSPGLLRYGVAWRNEECIHISAATHYDLHPGSQPGAAWLEAAAHAVTWALERYPGATVVGHKEIAYGPAQAPDHQDWRTACPGRSWAAWKPKLLARVAELRGQAAPAPAPVIEPPALVYRTTLLTTNCRTGPELAPGNVLQVFPKDTRWGYHPEPVRGQTVNGNSLWWHSGDDRFFVHDSCLK